MSSVNVRTAIANFLAANAPTEKQIDLTAQYAELKELIEDAGLGPEESWIGLQFIGDDEIPITVPATNTQGRYRETGAIFIHVVEIASKLRLGGGNPLLTRGETLRNLMRGRRIGAILIESVTPMNFEAGATLQFEGGYMSGSFVASYQYDLEL